MMRRFIKDSNIELINFSDLFENISVDFLNKLCYYNLIIDNEININQRDIGRILYHTVIYSICEEIISSNRQCKKVIIIPDTFNDNDIWHYCDKDKFIKKLTSALKLISKNLPLLIFFPKKPLDNDIFSSKLIRDEGEIKEFLSIIEIFIEKSEKKNISFEKIKKFAKEKKLDFLSDLYFNNLRTKQLMF